ncbi:MAG: small, acid-soluble spore protein, alpha/beta type [Halanaerobiaceae bacterium]|nr:small, acid-soluble spore protein, alpha/beta type [Halanaerobiaceae bacterium]
MSKKKKKTDDFTLLMLKLETARELGLVEKIKKVGWAGLTAEETGKIGGIITRKLKEAGKKKLEYP